MMGVGNVLPGHGSMQHGDQQLRFMPQPRTPGPDPPIGFACADEPSVCVLVSMVPQYAARVSTAISLVQATILHLETVGKYVMDTQTELKRGLRLNGQDRRQRNLVLESLLDPLLYYLQRCRLSICPEFRVAMTEEIIETQGLAALEKLKSSTYGEIADNTRFLASCVAEIQACHIHAQHWLAQLAEFAEAGLEREEQDLGVNLSFISRVQANSLRAELSSWLDDMNAYIHDVYVAVLPERAAVLLENPG